eukprot:s2345_g3.t3
MSLKHSCKYHLAVTSAGMQGQWSLALALLHQAQETGMLVGIETLEVTLNACLMTRQPLAAWDLLGAILQRGSRELNLDAADLATSLCHCDWQDALMYLEPVCNKRWVVESLLPALAESRAPGAGNMTAAIRHMGATRRFVYDGRTVYEWEQNIDECHIYIQPPPGVTKHHLDIKIESETWHSGILLELSRPPPMPLRPPLAAFDNDFRGAEAAAFLAGKSARTSSSFFNTTIKFFPKAPELKEQEVNCDQDLAVCNRECEKKFGDRRAEFEEPCKLAVSSHFSEEGCFPPFAKVRERQLGELLISQVEVGHELSNVLVAGRKSLHIFTQMQRLWCSSAGMFKYFFLHFEKMRYLTLTGDHMLRVHAAGEWRWRKAKEVKEGDLVENSEGEAKTVLCVTTLGWPGAYAPLTESGELLVDGWRCSCFAPRLELSHELCHAAFLPLRVLHATVGQLQHSKEGKDADSPRESAQCPDRVRVDFDSGAWCLRLSESAAMSLEQEDGPLVETCKDMVCERGPAFCCLLLPRHLRVGIKGNPPFLNEEPFSLVETDSSFWMIEDGELHIQMQKAHKGETWAAALKGQLCHGQLDMFSEQEINKKLMLERFQEEHPGFDFSGASFSGQAPSARTFMGGIHADPQALK